MKKKIICAILALATVVSLGACSSSFENDPDSSDSSINSNFPC